MPSNPIILRIDDRLIHGQVLVGWGSCYPLKHFIVANDEIARNDWEKELILSAVPPECDARVLTLEETLTYINEHLDDSELSMVLVSSPEDIKYLADGDLQLKQINVGGLHFNENRSQLLPYLFLSEDEIKLFEGLLREGYEFECQDVPTNSKYSLAKVLEKH